MSVGLAQLAHMSVGLAQLAHMSVGLAQLAHMSVGLAQLALSVTIIITEPTTRPRRLLLLILISSIRSPSSQNQFH